MKNFIRKMQWFFARSLWRQHEGKEGIRLVLSRAAQVFVFAALRFRENMCFLRSTALAYTVLLSIVPLLAFVFSILKGLGAEETAKPYILSRIAVSQPEVANRILEYVSNTNVAALGALGLITLLWTVIKVIGTMEDALNDIWEAEKSRSIIRKAVDYTGIIVIAPIFIISILGIPAFALTRPIIREIPFQSFLLHVAGVVVPYVLTMFAFAMFYVFMPNTKVRLLPALAGGAVGGTLWQATFWGYATFQYGMSSYNVIYTSFAALPIFLVWLYFSWVVTLYGAEVAFAVEHIGARRPGPQRIRLSPRAYERYGLRIFLDIASAFRRGRPAPAEPKLTRLADASPRVVREVLKVLVKAGLVSEVQGRKEIVYQPARDLNLVTAGAVLAAMRRAGGNVVPGSGDLWDETERLAGALDSVITKGDLARSVADILDERRKAKESQEPSADAA